MATGEACSPAQSTQHNAQETSEQAVYYVAGKIHRNILFTLHVHTCTYMYAMHIKIIHRSHVHALIATISSS